MFRSATAKALLVLVLFPVGADAGTPPDARDAAPAPRDVQSAAISTVEERTATSGISAHEGSTDADASARELCATLHALRGSKAFGVATTALYVVDAHTGDVLCAAEADRALNPASNVKLIATAAALDLLGPDFRYTTRVLGPRPSADGVVAGDLYVRGDWDPTLAGADLTSLAGALVQAGVRRVDGAIHVGKDTAIPHVRGSERESVHSPRIRIEVVGAHKPGVAPAVTVTPALDFIDIQVSATTVARTRGRNRVELGITSSLVTDEHGVTRWRIMVSGRVPTQRRARYQRTAPDGGLFSGHLLRQALRDAGVAGLDDIGRVERSTLTEYMSLRATNFLPVELARHESEPLGALVAIINKRSDNRLADRLTMTVGAARYGGEPGMDKGVRAMEEWLSHNAPADLEKTILDTGSGLSYRTQLTPRQIVDTVRAAAGYKRERESAARAVAALGDTPFHELDDPDAPVRARWFRESLAVAGVDGTLRRRFKRSSARRHVLGKTGTLTSVIALSGIVSAGPDRELIFALVSNDHPRQKRGSVRDQHERMVEAMYRWLRAR